MASLRLQLASGLAGARERRTKQLAPQQAGRRAVQAHAQTSNGSGGSPLLEWLRGMQGLTTTAQPQEKEQADGLAADRQQQQGAGQMHAAAGADQLQQHTVIHPSFMVGSNGEPLGPAAFREPSPPAQHHFQQPSHAGSGASSFSGAGSSFNVSSSNGGTNGGSGGSNGAMRANASDLLAGVPLQEMLERQRVQQQLERQQQQLQGRGGAASAGPAPAPAPTASPSGSSSSGSGVSSSTVGSLWGTTAQPSSPSSIAQPAAAEGGSTRAELSPITSPEAAVAFAAYERAISNRRQVPVRLCLRLAVEKGQRVKVVGGHSALGKWALDAAPELRRTDGDTWEATVRLPAGSVTEYKFAVVDRAGRPVAIQAGNNGVLAVGQSDERLEIMDSWDGDAAGVSVIVDGDRAAWPATRESRLVAWANELFQQVASLRHDLRKSRMELVGAQEESRAAQLEARRLLEELEDMKYSMVEMEAERAVDRAELAHTRAVNQVLQEQLADTTASLKEAIETAADLLASQTEDEQEEEYEDHEDEEEEVEEDEEKPKGR